MKTNIMHKAQHTEHMHGKSSYKLKREDEQSNRKMAKGTDGGSAISRKQVSSRKAGLQPLTMTSWDYFSPV
jgi:hypothetical protein